MASVKYTVYERGYLLRLSTKSTGQADDLKLETTNAAGVSLRYWVGRVGPDDGAARENLVTVECLVNGRWADLTTY